MPLILSLKPLVKGETKKRKENKRKENKKSSSRHLNCPWPCGG
jgi:hypothetical protein